MNIQHLFLTALAWVAASAQAAVQHVDNAELARLMAAGVAVIDIRTEGEGKETGIVPGSHWLTFFDERGRADAAGWLKLLATIARPDQPVIVICRTEHRTRVVADFLDRQAGYRQVYNVRAGIHGWLREGRAVQAAATQTAGCGIGGRC